MSSGPLAYRLEYPVHVFCVRIAIFAHDNFLRFFFAFPAFGSTSLKASLAERVGIELSFDFSFLAPEACDFLAAFGTEILLRLVL